MPVVVDQRQRRIPISHARLMRAVDRALAALGRPAGMVEIAVVDDAEIRHLNRLHRGIGRRTDVLAFPLEMPDAGPLVGQLVISADAAVRQARRLGVPLALELELLATHGTLHLAGYDDRDPLEADLMHRREREILGNTPARLWRGLLHHEARPTKGAVVRSRSKGEGASDGLTANRGRGGSKSRNVQSADRSHRPSRAGHPRLEPRVDRSLQKSHRPSRAGHPRLEPRVDRSLQ